MIIATAKIGNEKIVLDTYVDYATAFEAVMDIILTEPPMTDFEFHHVPGKGIKQYEMPKLQQVA